MPVKSCTSVQQRYRAQLYNSDNSRFLFVSTGQSRDIFELSFSSHYMTPAELSSLTSAVNLGDFFLHYLNV